MRLRAFRLSALKSLTGPLRRRRVGIPKSKEDGGKKLKQIGQGLSHVRRTTLCKHDRGDMFTKVDFYNTNVLPLGHAQAVS